MTSVRTNVSALSTHRHLQVTARAAEQQLRHLSSGLRIGRAADDAAGLVISEGLRSQVGGATVAARNVQDGISLLQTAEGALGEATAMLQRMRDLSLAALNDGAGDGRTRTALDAEFSELARELVRTGASTDYNGRRLLDGQELTTVARADTEGTLLTHTERAVREVVVAPGHDRFTLTLDGLAPLEIVLPHGRYPTPASLDVLNAAVRNQIAARPDYAGTLDLHLGGSTRGDGTLHSHLTVRAGLAHRDLTLADAGSGLLEALTQEPGTVALAQADTSAPQLRRQSLVLQVGGGQGETRELTVRRLADLVAGATAADLWHDPQDALRTVDAALQLVQGERASLGAQQNGLEHNLAALQSATVDLAAAESRIRDQDMAQGMTALSRHRIVQQAAEAMLAQANQRPQAVLELLKAA